MRISWEVRFWARVNKDGPVVRPELGNCWVWTGATDGRYGQISKDGRRQKAHRVSWEMVNGPMPPEMDACHKCDVTRCVRPDHIFPGTPSENARDAQAKGRIPQLDIEKIKRNQREKSRIWRLENPKAVRAKRALHKALGNGIIQKPEKCSKCLAKTKVKARHLNYDEPLKIEWYCNFCHPKTGYKSRALLAAKEKGETN